ncbi:MAG TPA: hypothetical protein VGX23_00270 [Actinocrinis sp.]|nr:hypothetical protein [Actinocrinis sp.]
MTTNPLPDDHPVTMTWTTTTTEEYQHTFTLGELREALRSQPLTPAPLPLDISDELDALNDSWLADFEDEPGALIEFTRQITETTDISLPTLTVQTVTVAGPERHDGEKPYTYCLHATDLDAARALALAHHIEQNELTYDWETGGTCDPDALVIEGAWETFTGAPTWPADLPGRAWNDLREDEQLLARAYRTAAAQ